MEGSAAAGRARVVGVLDGRSLDLPDLCLAVEGLLAAGADTVDLDGVDDGDRATVARTLPGRVVTDQSELTGAVTTSSVAAMAVAVVRGCRTIRTPDVRAARRVADVLAAVERGSASP
jgi:hypothetical protein